MNDEAIRECDEPRRNLDPRNAIAEMIDIGAHREVGVAVDLVRREQVRITRWMDAELKEHRRLSGAFKCYIEPCFNEHLELLKAQAEACAETVRARPSTREARRNANVCGEFVFLVAWDGRWLLASLKSRPVRLILGRSSRSVYGSN